MAWPVGWRSSGRRVRPGSFTAGRPVRAPRTVGRVVVGGWSHPPLRPRPPRDCGGLDRLVARRLRGRAHALERGRHVSRDGSGESGGQACWHSGRAVTGTPTWAARWRSPCRGVGRARTCAGDHRRPPPVTPSSVVEAVRRHDRLVVGGRDIVHEEVDDLSGEGQHGSAVELEVDDPRRRGAGPRRDGGPCWRG